MAQDVEARRLQVNGIVQGVGFRPFVYQLAARYGLKGEVANTSSGVTILIEGPAARIRLFEKDLTEKSPPLAHIVEVTSHPEAVRNFSDFRITASRGNAAMATLISPDCRLRRLPTLTETEKALQLSFISMTEAIVIAIKIVSFVVIFIIMAVVANTMAMTARERIGEYAIFITLGFGGWHLAGLIFGESLFITMIGCVLGIALTFPAANIFSNALSTYFPVFNVARKTIYMDIVASILIGMVAALFPTWRAIKIRIADGLRRIG